MSPIKYLLGAAFCVTISACSASDETSTEDEGVEVSDALCSQDWGPWKRCVKEMASRSGGSRDAVSVCDRLYTPNPCPSPKKPKK